MSSSTRQPQWHPEKSRVVYTNPMYDNNPSLSGLKRRVPNPNSTSRKKNKSSKSSLVHQTVRPTHHYLPPSPPLPLLPSLGAWDD